MRVLLTGGSGMVGRNILEHQEISDFEVLAPTHAELNLFNYTALEEYIKKVEPDMIIHAAGKVGGIQANINNPVSFLVQNLDMGRNIILAARQTGVKKFINLGSSCMYPRQAVNPLKEEYILQGELEPTNEGYALAKIMAARLCEYISREDKNYQYKTLIPCNLYGRWDKFNEDYGHMIPAVITKLHQAKQAGQETVTIWGDGTVRREFMNAADLADAVIYAIKNFTTLPNLLNIGLGYDCTINEYYQMIADVVGYHGVFVHDTTKPAGMKRKLVDISKQEAWGWLAKLSMRQGIARTYAFYLERIGEVCSIR
ncbi:MAG: GDP-L-fucose synthase [Pelosinus sp.]|nr:GDP-L-fucose synthase [Pelosinus sp.]